LTSENKELKDQLQQVYTKLDSMSAKLDAEKENMGAKLDAVINENQNMGAKLNALINEKENMGAKLDAVINEKEKSQQLLQRSEETLTQVLGMMQGLRIEGRTIRSNSLQQIEGALYFTNNE
jgi:septal ring factor EnvC (AmiA/AmiB activator)